MGAHGEDGLAERRAPPAGPGAAVLEVLADPCRLTLLAQPIVDLERGRVAGYELLSRLPSSWSVGPEQLFRVAHDLGLSAELEVLVLRRGLELLTALPDNTFLTVNVDPRDLTEPAVLAVLESRPSLAPLVLEITENSPAGLTPSVARVLGRLRSRGAMVAADDVGAGYAGLQLLLELRPDIVKVDRKLLFELGRDPAAEAMVTALGQLSGHLDAWLLAEGVERADQLTVLARLGVPLAQGYLFGRPAPPWALLPELTACGPAARTSAADTVALLGEPLSAGYVRDEHGRYHRRGESEPCLTLAPATPLREALSRALSRPGGQRWTPLLLTRPDGHAAGQVSMEALVAAVNGGFAPSAGHPDAEQGLAEQDLADRAPAQATRTRTSLLVDPVLVDPVRADPAG